MVGFDSGKYHFIMTTDLVVYTLLIIPLQLYAINYYTYCCTENLDEKSGSVTIGIAANTRLACPNCGKSSSVHDHSHRK
ncbi:putative transposase [Escherichia coli]|nr:putative transposase [Escherichia coli]CAD6086549.1 putative transposase [Escherichia coli]CAD6149544.1 putative transposase [Escherichia coli]